MYEGHTHTYDVNKYKRCDNHYSLTLRFLYSTEHTNTHTHRRQPDFIFLLNQELIYHPQYLLSEDHRAELVPKHVFQHGHQFFMVHVLDAIEVVEVQENNLSGVSRQETADLL